MEHDDDADDDDDAEKFGNNGYAQVTFAINMP